MIRITKDTPLKVVEEIGKECDRCNRCCTLDSGIVLEEDIPRIARSLKMSEERFRKEHLVEHDKFNTKCFKFKQEKEADKQAVPYGRCIMLDEKGCKIHAVKPLHCRVCSAKSSHGEALSQWFSLNYLVDPNDPESIRQWAIFLEYNESIPGGKLENLVPDKEKLRKIRSFELLK